MEEVTQEAKDFMSDQWAAAFEADLYETETETDDER